MGRLSQGAQLLGITLTDEHLAKFRKLAEELITWNSHTNLTAIKTPEEIETKHFLDSLSIAPALPRREKLRIADVGTGPGFPGLPLAIVFPNLRFTLMEAAWKKTSFIEHAVKELRLGNVTVIHERSETIAHDQAHRGKYDVVTARALAAAPTLVELTLPFCAIGGVVIAQKKGDIAQELRQAEKAARLMGGRFRESKPIQIPDLDDGRLLVIYEKIAHTPKDYPRRPGMPANKPIV